MLTSGFKLVVLFGLEDRMGDPQPRVMLPQLGDQVVGDNPHRPSQSVQHDSHKRLEVSRLKNERNRKRENTSDFALLHNRTAINSKRQQIEKGKS